MLRLSLGAWGETLEEMIEVSRTAEDRGFDGIWSAELHRTAFVPLAAIAAQTSRINIGSAVALAFVRSPMITALTALDLDDVSRGRLILGLGTGVQRLNESWHNVEFGRPASHLREVVSLVRRLIADSHRGVEITSGGEYHAVRIRGYQRPFLPRRTDIPIYLAGVGPGMTRLAGEIGDGWIGFELGSPRYFEERILPNLLANLERSGREREEFTVVTSVCCVPHRNGREAKRRAAGLVAFYATVRTYREFFAFHGFEREAEEIQRCFRQGDVSGMINAVPDGMVESLMLAGTPDDVRHRLARWEGLADEVKLTPPTHLVSTEVTRESQQAILDTFAM